MSIRLTVLISGNGSNLQALIDATTSHNHNDDDGDDPVLLLPDTKITHVISNRRSARGIERAQRAGIPTSYHPLAPYRTTRGENARGAYDADLAQLILRHNDDAPPDIVMCAGWMHVLSGQVLEPLRRAGVEVLNLHPARPGEFLGATDAIRRAWMEGREGKRDKTGVMVHRVVEEVDRGGVVLVEELDVDVDAGEGYEVFEDRVHRVEWRVVVEAVRRVGEGVRVRRGEGKEKGKQKNEEMEEPVRVE